MGVRPLPSVGTLNEAERGRVGRGNYSTLRQADMLTRIERGSDSPALGEAAANLVRVPRVSPKIRARRCAVASAVHHLDAVLAGAGVVNVDKRLIGCGQRGA